MAYKEVVEMLGDNLASLLELARKWLIEWKIKPKKLFHLFQNFKKSELLLLLDGSHIISPSKWREHNCVVYTSVISSGRSGAEWGQYFAAEEAKESYEVYSDVLEESLSNFRPTNKIVYELAIVRISALKKQERYPEKLKEIAHNLGWKEATIETGCLLREKFTDSELEVMGFSSLVIMHRPVGLPNSCTPPVFHESLLWIHTDGGSLIEDIGLYNIKEILDEHDEMQDFESRQKVDESVGLSSEEGYVFIVSESVS